MDIIRLLAGPHHHSGRGQSFLYQNDYLPMPLNCRYGQQEKDSNITLGRASSKVIYSSNSSYAPGQKIRDMYHIPLIDETTLQKVEKEETASVASSYSYNPNVKRLMLAKCKNLVNKICTSKESTQIAIQSKIGPCSSKLMYSQEQKASITFQNRRRQAKEHYRLWTTISADGWIK